MTAPEWWGELFLVVPLMHAPLGSRRATRSRESKGRVWRGQAGVSACALCGRISPRLRNFRLRRVAALGDTAPLAGSRHANHA